MATTTYTVKKGDTLSAIALKYNTTVSKLAELNDIDNVNYIVVGQVLKITGTTPAKTTNTTSVAIIKAFGLQSNTDRTVYATWTWDKSYTENYRVKWEYDTGDGVWFVGTDSTVTVKQSTYSGPTNASRVRFSVQPISKTKTVNGKETKHWTAGWSTAKIYSYSSNPPSTPSTPTVNIEGLKLTASFDNLNVNASIIQFELYRNNVKYKDGKAAVKNNSTSFSFVLISGSKYKVRCRANRNNMYSDWSEFTQEYNTIPSTPSSISKCEAKGIDKDITGSEQTGSLYVEWASVSNATKYTVQWADKKTIFDSTESPSQQTTESNVTNITIAKLAVGKEWFVRVRAENDEGNSGWTEISSAVIGTGPAAPTTWSSTNTAVIGEDIILYWIHNSEDGSSQEYAELEIYVNGKKEITNTQDYSSDTDKNVNRSFKIHTTTDTSATGSDSITIAVSEGATIQWSVKTAGISSTWGKSSVQRTIQVYQQPSVSLNVTDASNNTLTTNVCYVVYQDINTGEYVESSEEVSITNGSIMAGVTTTSGSQVYVGTTPDEIEVYYRTVEMNRLVSFPFNISTDTEPNIQKPISFHLSIKSNDTYETVDEIGNTKIISAGSEVYSKHFDVSEQLSLTMLPNDVSFENNINYTITCVVSMDSGLTATETFDFSVSWTNELRYEPNAELAFDEDTCSMQIRPYCEDENGNTIIDVLLSVYRREFDGSFTELITDIDSTSNTYITDPHPALDFARYRIVATYKGSGTVSYCDIPGYPVNCKSAIIQWDESWTTFDTSEESTLEQPAWSGSLLKLPYNLDVSDKYLTDVALVEYIGRSRPVSYYGTQLGETSTWNVVIKKSDKETLYGLRRLAIWRGNVYVREPSGSGYWANVKVSFNQKHCDPTIPVSLTITRVEGGA